MVAVLLVHVATPLTVEIAKFPSPAFSFQVGLVGFFAETSEILGSRFQF